MATFIIVSEDKDPLGPGEINAGDDVWVNEGDIFVISPAADEDVTFESPGGASTNFTVEFGESNSNNLEIKIEEGLTPSISIADNADLSDIKIDADKADAANLSIGDGVTLQEFKGSNDGNDVIDIGNDFTMPSELKTGDGDNQITIGDRADIEDIETGDGNDTIAIGDDFVSKKIKTGDGADRIIIGDRAAVEDIETGKGDDDITIGDDFVGEKIKTADGDDSIHIGANADLDEIDGGKGNDVLNTQSPGIDNKNIETINVVCFVRGTRIKTDRGEVCIEHLHEGDLVVTADHGLQPIRWIGSSVVSGWEDLAPILIPKSALANTRDLRVSPQHRMLIKHPRAQLLFETPEVLVPAKHLIGKASIRSDPCDNVQYFHMLFDQHEIVFSEGAASESFHPGVVGMESFSRRVQEEIFAIFPELRVGTRNYGAAARRSLKRHEAVILHGF
ncbi:Hint domain-containing protein [uncultured Tateyamaria sp.]|uniref:Hint domain-containing protein n=1 Tax=uncultured Tateyamaria sp. TaxID=455651 RepID=UPI002629AC9F|nr:Hint domain-containing protein [uncultured Tateyamaria sp.]